MTFGAPEWFWGFLAVPLLAAIFLRNETRRVRVLRQLVAARLLPSLAGTVSAARRRTKFTLALLGLACVTAALLQPRWGEKVVESQRRGLDVMIAVDTSKSMLSTDVQPDRLSRAKFAAQDLLDVLGGDRVGLIAFAGTAFVQAPLTIDDSAVLSSITDLDTNTIPRGGTDITAAIRAAAESFGKGESTQRALILFSDGEDLEEQAVQAAAAQKGNFRIFTVGVGTREGSLIPVMGSGGGTEFVKDAQGQFVKSHLDEERLRQIAEATGGFYIHLDNGPETMKVIIQQGLGKMTEHEFQAKETEPIQRYEWPLAAGMLLLCSSIFIRERRREPRRARVPQAVAASLALLLICPLAGHAKNAGVDLYDEKDYKGAYNVFQHQLDRNPSSDGLQFDEGTAAYKAGDYDKALESFGKVIGSQEPGLRSQAEYNLGNTLVQRGALQQAKEEKIKEWTDALQHYGEALKAEPENQDVKYNQDLVRKMIEELKKNPPPQQQQQQQQDKQQQKKDDQQKQDQKQNQSQQNQQQKDSSQKNQDQQKQDQQNQSGQGQKDQSSSQQQAGQNQSKPQQGQQGQDQQPQNGNQGQPQNAQQPSQKQPDGQAGSSPSPSPGQSGSDAQNQAQNSGQDQQPPQAGGQQNGNGSPSPTPAQKLSGDIKAQPGQENQQAKEQADARAASTEPAKAGEMTPSQARALIDSLRGEDEHVSLSGRDHAEEPAIKDW